jgi:hypothetical protein
MKNYAFWMGVALFTTSVASATTVLTFQVDMSQQIAAGAFVSGADAVNVHGTFNGWGNYSLTNNPAGANPSLYTGTVVDSSDATGAKLEYKYCINDGGWESLACNRAAVLPSAADASLTLPLVFFNDRAPATVSDNVTFRIDMTDEIALGTFNPSVDVVNVRGPFNGWGTTTMTNNPLVNSNIYIAVVPISDSAAMTEHFKFSINNYGWETVSDLNQDCSGNRYFNLWPTNGDLLLPLVSFSDKPVVSPVTNAVTFQVDMSGQVAAGLFLPADTVECRGTFNGWTGGVFLLTNNPAGSNPTLYTGTSLVLGIPGDAITYKFWQSDPSAAHLGYESPLSTEGNDRRFNLLAHNGEVTLGPVFFNDLSANMVLRSDTLVTFTVDMTGAVGTDGLVFDPLNHYVCINGDWMPWWSWAPGAAFEYQLWPEGLGSNYSITLPLPRGTPLALAYKYSINGLDNESGFKQNHVRYIRVPGNYTLPTDTFGHQTVEATFGNLRIDRPSGQRALVSWLGLPGVHLQVTTNLSGAAWHDLVETDGLNSTNYPVTTGQAFFRLIRAP